MYVIICLPIQIYRVSLYTLNYLSRKHEMNFGNNLKKDTKLNFENSFPKILYIHSIHKLLYIHESNHV